MVRFPLSALGRGQTTEVQYLFPKNNMHARIEYILAKIQILMLEEAATRSVEGVYCGKKLHEGLL